MEHNRYVTLRSRGFICVHSFRGGGAPVGVRKEDHENDADGREGDGEQAQNLIDEGLQQPQWFSNCRRGQGARQSKCNA